MTEAPLRLLAVLALVLAFVTVLAGCERTVAPPLVEVSELAPKEVEPGDRLEIHGTGFPQGRAGKIVLEGTSFRPGESPLSHVAVEADGLVAAPDRMDIVVRESLVERLCGRGDRASHATFHGDVQISFASNDPTAPPLIGRLRGATIDVQPSSVRASVLDARTAEGARLLAYLGITPGTSSPRGIPIEQVKAGSPAERAGMQTGDVLVAVDGVHALAFADIAPISARAAELTIKHADSGIEETKTVSLLDYSGERVPTEYAPAMLIVGLALAVLIVLVLPGPPALASLELSIAASLRRTTLRAAARTLFGSGLGAATSVLVTAAVAAFALTPWVVGREVDGVALFAAAAVLLASARVARARGIGGVVKSVLAVLIMLTIALASLALAVGQVGAIELSEIVRLQGALPWQLEATRHPACAVLAIVYFVTLIALLRTRAPTDPNLERAGVLLASALGVAVFLGGWQLPGAKPMLLAGATLFAVKTWVLAAICAGARRAFPALDAAGTRRILLRGLLPGLLLAGALVAGSRRIVPNIAVETAIGATLVALVTLFSLRIALRVRSAIGRPEPHASPFI